MESEPGGEAGREGTGEEELATPVDDNRVEASAAARDDAAEEEHVNTTVVTRPDPLYFVQGDDEVRARSPAVTNACLNVPLLRRITAFATLIRRNAIRLLCFGETSAISTCLFAGRSSSRAR